MLPMARLILAAGLPTDRAGPLSKTGRSLHEKSVVAACLAASRPVRISPGRCIDPAQRQYAHGAEHQRNNFDAQQREFEQFREAIQDFGGRLCLCPAAVYVE